MTASKLFDFLGRVLMAAVFVNALPAKFTNFAETAGFIASKGIPEPMASVLLVAAIVVLIAGSILLVFGSNTVPGASLLLLFLVPTTLIFHTSRWTAALR
ncbi:DoxX family protein [Synechococcus sp. AH-736-A19]|nr:DoxX family protein [Synechococcus sp. AH-736-A19]